MSQTAFHIDGPMQVVALLAALAVGLCVFVLLVRRAMRAAGVAVLPFAKHGFTTIVNTRDENGAPIRVLKVKGTWQSATYLGDNWCGLVFPYHRLFDRMYEARIPIDRVLMIGGGGFAYPKHLLSRNSHVAMDVVESDPEVTELARRYFFLDRLVREYDLEDTGRLKIISADGRAYVDETDTTYDVVMNDAFAARVAPKNLVDEEGAAAVKHVLKTNGLYMINVVTTFVGPEAQRALAITESLGTSFAHVWAVPCGDVDDPTPDNVVFIASDGTYEFSGSLMLR